MLSAKLSFNLHESAHLPGDLDGQRNVEGQDRRGFDDDHSNALVKHQYRYGHRELGLFWELGQPERDEKNPLCGLTVGASGLALLKP